MKRASLITILVFTLTVSGMAIAGAAGGTATDAVNRIFAETALPSVSAVEPPATPAESVTAAASVASVTSGVVTSASAADNQVLPTGDKTVSEHNVAGDEISSHHEIEPWITVSARVFFPKLTVGVNPNINNSAFILKYQEDDPAKTQHTATINVSNITKDGYIDLVGLSGMSQQFSASPEVDFTFWNWLTLSWTQLKGSGSATTQFSATVDSLPANSYTINAQTDLTLDLIGVQFLNWGFLRTNWIDLNLLAGVQLFWPEQFNYNYSTNLPGNPSCQGSSKVPFPVGTPYYGLGADLQFGDFTLTGSYSGLAGLDSLIANYTKVDLNYYVLNADLNYAFTKNISIDAGYRLFNLQPTLQSGFQQKWMPNQDFNGNNIDGYSTLLRAEGPYGGVTVRF
ncbi:MAG: hypothetical protein WCV63_07140 [Negativicutes bacterium]|jgi:hypothetical protein